MEYDERDRRNRGIMMIVKLILLFVFFQVRTKDKEFDSVGHLIRYHSDNCLPIISSESMVLLQNPVVVRQD